jgi:NAD-dependent dihydropyrimidine dehydrogenase PreA subunit
VHGLEGERFEDEQVESATEDIGGGVVGHGQSCRSLQDYINAPSVAVNRSLNRETVEILSGLQKLADEWLRLKGFRSLLIPPDSDRRKDKLITRLYKLFCHKTAATCSGLGWVGKNGLVINRMYGSKLSWATVLTNSPFEPDEPVRESECGDCNLCVTHCPSGAIRGDHWSISEPKKKIVADEKCSALKEERQSLKDKPNCGFCVTVCPYSRSAAKK